MLFKSSDGTKTYSTLNECIAAQNGEPDMPIPDDEESKTVLIGAAVLIIIILERSYIVSTTRSNFPNLAINIIRITSKVIKIANQK